MTRVMATVVPLEEIKYNDLVFTQKNENDKIYLNKEHRIVMKKFKFKCIYTQEKNNYLKLFEKNPNIQTIIKPISYDDENLIIFFPMGLRDLWIRTTDEDGYYKSPNLKVDESVTNQIYSIQQVLDFFNFAVFTIYDLYTNYNIIYTDIKDENFIVMEDGSYKLIDFEIIYDRRNSESKLNPSLKYETLSFQPYEFFSGKQYNLMSGCIWSLGALLFDMVFNENFHDNYLLSWNKIMNKFTTCRKETFKKRVNKYLQSGTTKSEFEKNMLLIRPEINECEKTKLIKNQIIEYIQNCMKFEPKNRITISDLYFKTQNFVL